MGATEEIIKMAKENQGMVTTAMVVAAGFSRGNIKYLVDKGMIEKLALSYDMGPEPDTVALLLRKGAKVKEVQVEMSERIAGKSYLTLTKSINYMARMLVSILILQWFRRG